MNLDTDMQFAFTEGVRDYILEKQEYIKNNPDLTVIGHITADKNGINLISKGEQVTPIVAQGWEHFKN